MNNQHKHFGGMFLRVFTAIAFVTTSTVPAFAQSVMTLPPPGTLVATTNGFAPAMIKGVTVDEKNPFHFNFIVDTGETGLTSDTLKPEAQKLVKYFLASLTIPEDQKWVNLSPYEKDRIIPESLGQTEMGRDMLAQDYMLKQLTASMMYPENELGRKFWERVYAKATLMFGSTDIPMNTFNKIWIVPSEATVYESGQTAFVVKRHLKVYLEKDYVALQKNLGVQDYGLNGIQEADADAASSVTSDVVRDVLIPEIEKEVNEGEIFANLRQIYNAMILATWYRRALQQSLLTQVYANQNKVSGIEGQDPDVKNKIYNQYLQAFQQGVYDLLKEDYDPKTDQMVVRKYFSGGATYDPDMMRQVTVSNAQLADAAQDVQQGDYQNVDLALLDSRAPKADGAMLERQESQKARLNEGSGYLQYLVTKYSDNKFVVTRGYFENETDEPSDIRSAIFEGDVSVEGQDPNELDKIFPQDNLFPLLEVSSFAGAEEMVMYRLTYHPGQNQTRVSYILGWGAEEGVIRQLILDGDLVSELRNSDYEAIDQKFAAQIGKGRVVSRDQTFWPAEAAQASNAMLTPEEAFEAIKALFPEGVEENTVKIPGASAEYPTTVSYNPQQQSIFIKGYDSNPSHWVSLNSQRMEGAYFAVADYEDNPGAGAVSSKFEIQGNPLLGVERLEGGDETRLVLFIDPAQYSKVTRDLKSFSHFKIRPGYHLKYGADDVTQESSTDGTLTRYQFLREISLYDLEDFDVHFDGDYMLALYNKYLRHVSGKGAKSSLKIGENFTPSADLPANELKAQLGVLDYAADLMDNPEYKSTDKKIVVRLNPMDGGLGSSMKRERYLQRLFGRGRFLGAKSTDSYFRIPVGEKWELLSVAELKFINAIVSGDKGGYEGVVIEELVNAESLEKMEQFLDTIYFFDRVNSNVVQKRTYRQVIQQTPGLSLADRMIQQGALPVVDMSTGQLTDKYTNPGGHGQLGFFALKNAAEQPTVSDQSRVDIRVLYNGDGPNNSADLDNGAILRWMAEKNIPIVMITTTTTQLDMKGGKIGLQTDSEGNQFPQIMELAQAKEAGQAHLFQEVGLRAGDGEQLFNTNVALVNMTVLQPFLKELRELLGEEAFLDAIAPDLIMNAKPADKPTRYQLEGAMGSAYLNLNKFVKTSKDPKVSALMQKYGFDRLLYFVNVDPSNRDKVFTPVKYAWDFWLYSHTDHFSVNISAGKIVNNRPGHLPGFEFVRIDNEGKEVSNAYYEDLENVIEAFGNTSVIGLDHLKVVGNVSALNVVLKGNVTFINENSAPMDINHLSGRLPADESGRIVVENKVVTYRADGSLEIRDADRAQLVYDRVEPEVSADSAQLFDSVVSWEGLKKSLIEYYKSDKNSFTVDIQTEGSTTVVKMTGVNVFDSPIEIVRKYLRENQFKGYRVTESSPETGSLNITITLADQVQLNVQRVDVPEEDLAVSLSIGTSGIREILKDLADWFKAFLPKSKAPVFNKYQFGRMTAASVRLMQKLQMEGLHQPVNGKKLRIAVFRDAREKSEEAMKHQLEVLAGFGDAIEVEYSDEILTTPEAIALSAEGVENRYDLVLFDTASHNDISYLGIKFGFNGTQAPRWFAKMLMAEANNPQVNGSYDIVPFENIEEAGVKKVSAEAIIGRRYEAAIPSSSDAAIKAFVTQNGTRKIYLDSMHGSPAAAGTKRLAAMGAETVRLVPMSQYPDFQKVFKNKKGEDVLYKPDPTDPTFVTNQPEFIDFVQNAPEGSMYLLRDGDGDRDVVYVKENGVPVEYKPEDLGAIEFWYMIQEGYFKNNDVVVVTQPTSLLFEKIARKYDIAIKYVPVGSNNFEPYVRPSSGVQAGIAVEESGHKVLRVPGQDGQNMFFFDDAAFNLMFMLKMMADRQQDLKAIYDNLKQDVGWQALTMQKKVQDAAIKDRIVGLLQNDPGVIVASLEQALGEADSILVTVKPADPRGVDEAVDWKTFTDNRDQYEHVYLEGIRFQFGNFVTQIRPSGTEPLLRIYQQVLDTPDKTKDDLEAVRKDFERKLLGALEIPVDLAQLADQRFDEEGSEVLSDLAQLTQDAVKAEVNRLLDQAKNGFGGTTNSLRRIADDQVVVTLQQLKIEDQNQPVRYNVQIKPAVGDGAPAVKLTFSRPAGQGGIRYVGLDEVVVEEGTTITMENIQEALRALLSIKEEVEVVDAAMLEEIALNANIAFARIQELAEQRGVGYDVRGDTILLAGSHEAFVTDINRLYGSVPGLLIEGNTITKSDAAMNAKNPDQKAEYGGINLNDAMLDLQIKRDGNGVVLPVSDQPIEELKMNIPGFTPVIIKITPITNIPAYLSQVNAAGDSNSASADKDADSRLSMGPVDRHVSRL